MIKKYISQVSFAVLLGLFPWTGHAHKSTIVNNTAVQQKEQLEQLPLYQPLNEYGSFVIRLNQKVHLTEQEFLSKVNTFFGLNETNTFELIHSYADRAGKIHNTYQHRVGSYPVEGQMFILHRDKNGRVSAVNGTIINIENKKSRYSLREQVKEKIPISKDKARSIAFQANNLPESKALDVPVETVFVKSIKQKGLFLLAHKVRVDDFSTTQIQSKNVFVDVEKGDIIHEISLLAHTDVLGRGDGFYRANLPLHLQLVDGYYQMIDSERNITTFDGESSRRLWDVYNGVGTVYNQTAANFSPSPINDLHWGLARTYDYYKEVHNQRSYDNLGGDIKAFYNVVIMDGDRAGFPNNAVAIPAPYNTMVFGRGGDSFNPLTGLDIVGHEFTHLVVDNNGRGGLYYQGESGALNEGFADIFGTSIEHYAVNDADWFIGTGVIKDDPIHFMRSMRNPKESQERSRQPNTYKGEYWVDTTMQWDNGGVHFNSGVLNYWYYLLVEGGTGVNDIGNDYIVSGIGLKKAEQIAFWTLLTQLGSNSQYIDAMEGTLTVVEELYGADSEEYFAVYDAWYAVGFGEPRQNMGVEDFKLVDEVFSLYPNPVTNGELTVLTKDDQGVVAFYTMAGQKVTRDFPVEKGENKLKITQLSRGNYIVVYESKERKISEKIVVK